MLRKILYSAVVAVVFAAVAQPASAQWSDAERKSCHQGCLGTCEKNPNVSVALRSKCPVYCSCACAGSEFVAPNYTQFNTELGGNQDNIRTKAIKAIIPVCNARAFN